MERNRAMCPTYFEQAVDHLWDAANIPAQKADTALADFQAHHACH